VKQGDREAAAAASVEGELAVSNLAELHGRLRRCFVRVTPLAQARKYVTVLMSDLATHERMDDRGACRRRDA
jgi:hypothetical protein